MNAEESTRFKALVKPHLDRAVDLQGGIETVRQMYKSLGEPIAYFLGGIIYGALAPLNAEEVRRILDLVRLRLESDSATS